MYLEKEAAPSSLFIGPVQEGGLGAPVALLLPDAQPDVGLPDAPPAPLDAAVTQKEQEITFSKTPALVKCTSNEYTEGKKVL